MYPCILGLSWLLAAAQVTPFVPYEDLSPELVDKIAAAVAPLQRVHVTARDDDDGTRARQLEAHIVGLLAARGLRAADRAAGVADVTVSCSQNLRERVCAADIRKGEPSQFVTASRRHDAGLGAAQPGPLALDVRTVFTQNTPILDIALAGNRLVVLEPSAVASYQRRQNGWELERSRPIVSSRVPARDGRGRLHLDGPMVEALLPGVICRANIETLNVSCADEQQPWPIGVENSGMAAGRNYFTTPEGLGFFSSTPLDTDSGARWLLTSQDGRLLFLDAARHTIESLVGMGDDVAGVSVSGAGCPAGTYVIASMRASSQGVAGAAGGTVVDDVEALALFQVVGHRLIAAAPPVVLPGRLSALWAAPGSGTATAVSRDITTGRYEAFHVAITCGR